jgi:hypothetical protein
MDLYLSNEAKASGPGSNTLSNVLNSTRQHANNVNPNPSTSKHAWVSAVTSKYHAFDEGALVVHADAATCASVLNKFKACCRWSPTEANGMCMHPTVCMLL